MTIIKRRFELNAHLPLLPRDGTGNIGWPTEGADVGRMGAFVAASGLAEGEGVSPPISCDGHKTEH